jgi:CHASE3 domain sensor protein
MRKKFRGVLLVGYLAILLSFLGLSYFYKNALKEEEAHITSLYYDHEIITALQDILISLQRAESNRRGYVITKNMEYVENYNTAVEAVDEALNRLRQGSAKGIYQDKFLDSLEANVRNRIGSIKSSLELFKMNRSSDSAQIAMTDEGRDLMISIRGTMLELLSERRNARDDSYRSIGEIHAGVNDFYQSALYLMIFVLCALSIITYFYFRKTSIIDDALHRDLMQARQQVQHATSRYERLLEKLNKDDNQTKKEE